MPRTKRPVERPPSETWEIAVVASPSQVDDKPVLGVGLAVDVSSGQVRWASPIGVITDVISGVLAATTKYGMPLELCYEDSELDFVVAHIADALSLSARKVPCPTLERAEQALLVAMAGGMPAAGMPLRIDAWRRIVAQLHDLAPWTRLGERTWFHFQGGPLDGAVAVLIGELDEAWGVTLYPTEEALLAFISAATTNDHKAIMNASTLSIQLEREGDLASSDVSLCRSLDLVFEDRVPRLLALGSGALRAPTRNEQRLLLAAVEGVTTLCASEMDALAQGLHRRLQMIVTGGQRLDVEAKPAALDDLDDSVIDALDEELPPDHLPTIIHSEHAVLFGSMTVDADGTAHPSVVLKMRKREALKLAQACEWIASLSLHRHSSGLQLVACDERGARATLVKLRGGGLDELSAHLMSAGVLYLAISAGGPTRSRIRSAEFVYAKMLPVVARVS